MPIPTVWTERESSGIGWTDCTWCSILMVVAGAGNTKWPLGYQTEAERKAFRAGDPRLNFSGGVEAASNRYGVTVVSPTPYTQAGLRVALAVPNRVYAVAGKLSNFPAGHRLRRWAPTFTGFHAVAIATLGGGACRWLDPLAPMGFAGEPVTIAEVADIFCLSNYPNDARHLPIAGGDTLTEVTINMFVDGPRTCTIPAGGKVDGWTATGTAPAKSQVWPTGSNFPADALVSIKQVPQRAPNGTFYRCSAGVYLGLYIPNGQVSLGTPINPPQDTTAAYNAGVAAAATEALKAKK